MKSQYSQSVHFLMLQKINKKINLSTAKLSYNYGIYIFVNQY